MSQKQQALMNLLNKYVRQYFLYEEKKPSKTTTTTKIKLRNKMHCLEKITSKQARHAQLKQRLQNDQMGQLTPEYISYKPVSGWPVLRLEELVLSAMEKHLDPKIWGVLRSYFAKPEVRRAAERKDLDEALKDLTVVFKFRTAGFNRLRAHLAETEARMHNVKAGYDFQQHLIRTCQERHKKEAAKEEHVRKYCADPNVVVAKERVRRGTVNFLRMVKYILEKLLLLRIRHLRSHTPIALQHLGNDKDRESSKHMERVHQYHGGPPVMFSFKEQITSEAPPAWPLSHKYKPVKKVVRTDQQQPTFQLSGTTSRSHLGVSEKRRSIKKLEDASPGSDMRSASESDVCFDDFDKLLTKRVFRDTDMVEHFRKRWPPVWMSLAAMEQGCNIVDPQCPTREYGFNQNGSLGRKKSMSDVLARRDRWAEMRNVLEKSVKETLWREDKERLEFFRVQYAGLHEVPLAKPYDTHLRHMQQLLAQTRTERQKKTIFDCELSDWYKYLVIRVQEEVGEQDEEINQLLESVKVHFKMSPTNPNYGKAKLALITMSLTADVVTQIHVQRAIRFVIYHVLQAPESLLIGWLATRGLPFVLISSHAI